MAPTGRGGLRPYQPSKFQPFIIVCLIVTVIVVGFNFWNLMKKNSLLLVEIGKVQRDFKRVELEKKDFHVQFKDAEEKRKKHEDADHEKEILLEDTRRIVEDLKSEGETLRQNITKLQSHIASAEILDSRKEKKSQSECEEKLEELRLQSQSSCFAEKEKLQQETAEQLNTMKKQLKLQYEKTQQLDQQLQQQQQQQQKQRATEDETKDLQPVSNSPPVDNAYAQQQGDVQKQQRQQQLQERQHEEQQLEERQHEEQQLQERQHEEQRQQHKEPQQQHEEQQRHEEQRLEQQWQEKQRQEQKEMQQNNRIDGQADQKLSSGQQIQRQGQQNGSLGERRRQRNVNVQGNGAYRQFGKQSSGLRSKISRRQVPVGRMDQQEQAQGRDTDTAVRQGDQQQERTERDQNEEVHRSRDVQPPQRIKEETNVDEQQHQPGSTRLLGGEQSQLELSPEGGQKLLFKRSDQNATGLAASGGSELTADESTSQTSDQLKLNVVGSNNDAVDGDTAKPNQGDVNEANHLQGQTGDSERVNESASAKPPSDNKLIQNEQDHQDLRQDGQEKNKSPYHDSNSLDAEKAPEGNVEV